MNKLNFFFMLILSIAIVLQTLASLLQYYRIQRQYQQIRKHNEITSVGKARYLGNYATAIIGMDHSGYIKEVFVFKGFTAFAHFLEIPELRGKHYSELSEYCQQKKSRKCIAQAVSYIQEKMDTVPAN
jgi:DNA-binding transcriptional regulator of glucitol operon